MEDEGWKMKIMRIYDCRCYLIIEIFVGIDVEGSNVVLC